MPATSVLSRGVPSPRFLLPEALRWRRELVLVAVLPLLLAAATYAAGEASLLRSLRDWVVMAGGYDSWAPMEKALALMRMSERRAYEELFFAQGVKFQYPPSSLLVHELLARAGVLPTERGLNLANWFLVPACAALCGLLAARLAAGVQAVAGKPVMPPAVAAVAGGFVALLCYPVLKAYALGQVQLWLDTLFVAACLAFLSGRRAACGVLLGAICLIKPQFSLFLAWALLRREWRLAAGWSVTVGAGLACSLAFFGLQNHLDYLRVLGALAATGEAYYPNLSVNGILNRLLGTAPATTWELHGFPPYHPVVRIGTQAAAVLLVGAGLLLGRQRAPRLLDLQAAALAFTMASPIAWEHHYGILPPMVIALYFAILAGPPAGQGRRLALLATCYLVGFNLYGFAHHADSGWPTLAHAYLFLAALGLLGLLLTVARPPAAARTS